jgi:hypothetical protein
MKTRTGLLAGILLAAGLLASVAQAGAPMGPPMATLGEGHWGFGGEYGYESIDLRSFGTVTENVTGFFVDSHAQLANVENLGSNMFFGTVAYGICDNWDVFARVGAANAQDDIVLFDPNNPGLAGSRAGFDGGFGLAWGVGTRATFCRSGPWSFGGLAQVTWYNPGKSDTTLAGFAIPDETVVGNAELKYWQAQLSLDVAYQMDTLTFWAGPLLQFVQGDLDINGNLLVGDVLVGTFDSSLDIEESESSQVGAHFGANWKMADQLHLWGEGQVTGDSWLVGVGLVFVPEESTTGL